MSRQNENPVYEEAQHDEIVEDSLDEDLAEIQAASAAMNTNARTPQQPIQRELTGQRMIPPPPPPMRAAKTMRLTPSPKFRALIATRRSISASTLAELWW